MDIVILTSILFFTFLVFLFASLLRTLARRSGDGFLDPADWASTFAPAKYEPLRRLFAERDFKLVSSFPQGTKLVRRLRANRIRICRGYVDGLAQDFAWAAKVIKVLMIRSETDRSDLAAILLRQRFVFTLALISLEYRLLLYRFGLNTFNMSVFIEPFESLRTQLRSLAMAAQPVSAAATI
ncbi:MAG TPA: hypothetical protein VEU11_06020 [Terriglobales bacterium]|nr:hypothetical protein [Terriglobales bacterium]